MGSAGRGQTSVGWFYGFKLHLIRNDQGELSSCYLTAGNTDDRKQAAGMVKKARRLFGKLFGDKGYISKAPAECLQREREARLADGHQEEYEEQVGQSV